jgi:hypothetical protein
MDFDNLQSVSNVSDTLPYEAVSITDRDCFWDGSVPNPLEVSVGSPTMSVSSNIPDNNLSNDNKIIFGFL